MNKKLSIILADENKFIEIEKQWTDLLINSTADPLFCSWEWNYSWWKVWKPRLRAKLYLFLLYNNNELASILPCYKSQLGPKKTLQFIGNHYGSDDSIRSSYTGPIIRQYDSIKNLKTLINFAMNKAKVSRLILPDAHPETILKIANLKINYIVERNDSGYCIKTTDSLAKYKSKLGKNTRAQAYNQRNRVEGYSIQHYNENSLSIFLQQLNNLYKIRWKQPCYSGHSIDFIKRISKLGIKVNGITLTCKKTIISALLYYQTKETIYFIQLGFDDTHKRFRAGYLAIGELLQLAFENPDISYVDLLPGKGMKNNYKTKFKGEEVNTKTITIFKSEIDFHLHRFKHKIKFRLKKILKALIQTIRKAKGDLSA